MKTTLLSVGVAAFAAGLCPGQPSSPGPFSPPPNGPRRADSTWTALSNCTVHVRPGVTLEHASVIIRDGVIAAVVPAEQGMGDGEAGPARLPIGPRVVDAAGLHVYAAFIDPYVEVTAPDLPAERPGKHWNDNVTPERDARSVGALDAAMAEAMRKAGFGAAAIAPAGGVFRGWSAVVSLARSPDDPSSARPPVYRERVYQGVSFEGGRGGYPGSQMGAIALIRQTLSDAAWQQAARAEGRFDGPRNALDELFKEQVAGEGRAGPVLLFDVADELEALRAAKIAREFGLGAVILGSGTEFRRLPAIAADGLEFILPLNYPRAPDVSTPARQESVELRDMMTWEQAPTNARRLARAGVRFSLTTARLRDRGQFLPALRKAIACGLTEDEALAALTTTPADLLGVAGQLGTVEAGRRANLVVCDGPIFAEKTRLHALYVDGRAHELYAPDMKLDGEWAVEIPGAPEAKRRLVIEEGNSITVHRNDKSVKAARVQVEGRRVSFTMDHEPLDGQKGVYVMSAAVERDDQGRPTRMIGQGVRAAGQGFAWTADRLPDSPALGRWRVFEEGGGAVEEKEARTIVVRRDGVTIRRGDKTARGEEFKLDGAAISFEHDNKPFGDEGVWKATASARGDELAGESARPDGSVVAWKARRVRAEEPRRDEDDPALKDIPEALVTPFGPYGFEELPPQGTVALTNATLWMNTGAGRIERGTVVIRGGKIELVGAGVAVPEGATVIDCAGKHITPGIIDCHSHTGISRGVNEGGQAVTAEVRIQDVTNPDTTNWYWQLAGGVTAVLSLHGSANAIGGQSQTNKVRWGVSHPDQMHMEGAIPGIKFALGENPRRANSAGFQREGGAGAGGGARYPATRMGVEMLIRDRFTAAREYAASRARGEKVRRDLELEALAEILAGERLVHCHSYRQDEILMLANVSREFGFRIGTFQHILEGYKVADHVRDTSGGGSGFSDWWAYKMEVQDAIPGGLPLMHDAGCVVSFNSDSDELARRLNVEAGKAVKYGGLAEEEALKFVTLNPARQLKIDGRVGTLEAGRDADVVVWSGPPMSTFTKAERTFVDGRELFSLERDAASRGAIAAERARLVQKLLAERRSSGGGDGEAGRREGGPPAGGVGRRRRPPTDDEAAALRRWYEDLIFRGKTPNEPGVCGCGLEHEW